jgi:hypothetical protein
MTQFAINLAKSNFVTNDGTLIHTFKVVGTKSDAELAAHWRCHKDTYLKYKELLRKRKSKNARRKRPLLNELISRLTEATTRHMSEIGKKGGEKMARRRRQAERRAEKERKKAEHKAEVAARHAKREAERQRRAELDARLKAETAEAKKQPEQQLVNFKGRTYKVPAAA